MSGGCIGDLIFFILCKKSRVYGMRDGCTIDRWKVECMIRWSVECTLRCGKASVRVTEVECAIDGGMGVRVKGDCIISRWKLWGWIVSRRFPRSTTGRMNQG